MTFPGRRLCSAVVVLRVIFGVTPRAVLGVTFGPLLVLALALASPANAAEPRWPEGAYNYFVVDQDVRAVLEQFSRHTNIPLRLSGDIARTRVRGKLGAPTAKAFLQSICDSFRLVWYFDGATLHVVPQNAQHNVYLDLGPLPLSAFRQRLEAAGISEERFPIRPTADPQIIAVAGPPLYTRLLSETLAAMKDIPLRLQIRAPVEAPPAADAPQRQTQPQSQAPAGGPREAQSAAPRTDRRASKLPRRIASPRYMQGGDGRAIAAAAQDAGGVPSAASAPAAAAGKPAAPMADGQPAASSAGEPASAQGAGIDLQQLTAEERKRLTRQLIYEDEAARRIESGKVLVFRGGY